MKIKSLVSLMLTALFIVSWCSTAVLAVENSKGICTTAEVLAPVPEIGITVDTSSIDFGPLYLGTSSESKSVNFTNIGTSSAIIDVAVADLNDGNVFEPGIKVNGVKWEDYSSELVADAQSSFNAILSVPADANIGEASGRMTVWAKSSTTGGTTGSDSREAGDAVKFLIQYRNGTAQWINGGQPGDTILQAWDDAVTFNKIEYTVGGDPEYPNNLDTIFGLGTTWDGEPWQSIGYWWKVFVNDGSNLSTWDGQYSMTGYVPGNHTASEHPYVAFVYGNWQTTPLVNPEDFRSKKY